MAPFRAIIVGGGLVGLTLANALSLAGIDYVVLEKRATRDEDIGAGIVLGPAALRFLAQLGLLDKVRAAATPLGSQRVCTVQGRLYNKTHISEWYQENHGIRIYMYWRADFLRHLHDNLNAADQAKIHFGKQVVSISSDSKGARVTCADGTTYHGSIVIGADGVHSLARQHINQALLSASQPPNMPIQSHFRTLWCSLPRVEQAAPGDWVEVHGDGVAVQVFTREAHSAMFVYERRRAGPTVERKRYDEAAIEAFAERFGDVRVTEQLCVKDIFARRIKAGLTDVGEGVAERWSCGRVVLVGDAAHKQSTAGGSGYQTGAMDVVRLTNGLRAALEVDAEPTDEALAAVFARYQGDSAKNATAVGDQVMLLIRMATWFSLLHWMLDRYVLPAFPSMARRRVDTVLAERISKAPVLDFLDHKEPFQGRVPWVRPEPLSGSKTADSS